MLLDDLKEVQNELASNSICQEPLCDMITLGSICRVYTQIKRKTQLGQWSLLVALNAALYRKVPCHDNVNNRKFDNIYQYGRLVNSVPCQVSQQLEKRLLARGRDYKFNGIQLEEPLERQVTKRNVQTRVYYIGIDGEAIEPCLKKVKLAAV
jgi:hypothetical protein